MRTRKGIAVFLSDRSIREAMARAVDPLVITAMAPAALQPASVDVRLAPRWLREVGPGTRPATVVSYRGKEWYEDDGDVMVIAPGEFVLASTIERFAIPADMVAFVEGKSSWARDGLLPHMADLTAFAEGKSSWARPGLLPHMAGMLDPGWHGTITLELLNVTNLPIAIEVGEYVVQVMFANLDGPAQRPYGAPGLGSHYQQQDGVTPAR